MVNDSLMANVFRHNAQRRPDVLLKYYIDFFLYPANRIIHNVLWQRKPTKARCATARTVHSIGRPAATGNKQSAHFFVSSLSGHRIALSLQAESGCWQPSSPDTRPPEPTNQIRRKYVSSQYDGFCGNNRGRPVGGRYSARFLHRLPKSRSQLAGTQRGPHRQG